jgi:hypothetical protein
MDSVHGSWTSAGVAGPRVYRGLPAVADGNSSPELGLAATPGHGGLPRGWRRDGHDAARPGDHSPKPG